MAQDTSREWSFGGKRVIFTVTTGRSGTEYLTSLLKCFQGLTAVHEPEPEFTHAMHEGNRNRSVAEQFLLNEKLPAIRQSPHATYIETSHVFCKGFFEPLLSHGLLPRLILLYRDPIQVANSMYALGTIPGRHDDYWYLRPDFPGVLRFPGWENAHDWALCYWHCLEIERRSFLYEQILLQIGGNCMRTSIDKLKTHNGLDELADFVDVKMSDHDRQLISLNQSKQVNLKLQEKMRHRAIDDNEIKDLVEAVNRAVARRSILELVA